jgi:thiamine-phosphate pyrophosphorylase
VSLTLPRLYAILDVDRTRDQGLAPLELLELWLDAGIRLVQLRAKSMPFGPMLELAEAVVARTHAAGGLAIVNDRVDVARLANADGVHLGQDDLSPADARPLLGSDRLIGFSTHSVAQVEAALALPIDYLAIGPVFATASKARPDPVVGLEGVRTAIERAGRIPVVAIGGITFARAPDVLACGAASIAVISDLLTSDPKARALEWLSSVRGGPTLPVRPKTPS